MMIELSQLPPALQAQILTADTLQVVRNGQIIKQYTTDEQAYGNYFYRHHFDRHVLQQAIGETDNNGCAKHTLSLPKGLAKDKAAFRAWVKANAS